MSEQKPKMTIMIMIEALFIVFFAIFIGCNVLSFCAPGHYMPVDTTNHVLQTRPPEFLHCLETLPIEYKDDYHSLIKDKPEPIDYKAACEIILKKIENDKVKGKKE